MNRTKLSIIAATVLVAGTLGAQQPKPAPRAMGTAASADTTHKGAKKGGKKAMKHDSTAKHDSLHAAAKKPKKP